MRRLGSSPLIRLFPARTRDHSRHIKLLGWISSGSLVIIDQFSVPVYSSYCWTWWTGCRILASIQETCVHINTGPLALSQLREFFNRWTVEKTLALSHCVIRSCSAISSFASLVLFELAPISYRWRGPKINRWERCKGITAQISWWKTGRGSVVSARCFYVLQG